MHFDMDADVTRDLRSNTSLTLCFCTRVLSPVLLYIHSVCVCVTVTLLSAECLHVVPPSGCGGLHVDALVILIVDRGTISSGWGVGG